MNLDQQSVRSSEAAKPRGLMLDPGVWRTLSTPALPLGLLFVAAWIAWACLDGGFESKYWGPIGVAIVVALAIGVVLLGVDVRSWGGVRIAALGSLLAFVAWSFLSILWADVPGDAWVGADKTLLYAACFAVFAVWPWAGRSPLVVLAAYCGGVAIVGAAWVVHVAVSGDPGSLFDNGRLIGPTNYENASVALWMLALWPAVYLGSIRSLPAPLRIFFLAGGTLLVDLAILGQSRAWVLVTPIAAAVYVLLARKRLRAVLALAIVGIPAAAILKPLLDVFDSTGRRIGPSFDRAAWFILAAVLLSAALAGIWVVLDRRVELTARARRAAGIAVAAAVAGVVLVALVVALARVDDPGDWLSARWHDFSQGYEVENQTGSRLGGSLSGQRYEEWKVAWAVFLDHPAGGIGADNFQTAYLERRLDNFHEPLYPHSIPLRLLSQLGVVGTLLFVAFLVLAVILGLRRRRSADVLAGGASAAALTMAFYWLLHGSADVLWEIPAVAAPAFGMLGLAGSSDARPDGARPRPAWTSRPGSRPPRRSRSRPSPPPARWPCRGSRVSTRTRARSAWRRDARLAYDRLGIAADLDPLSSGPLVVEGSIAVRLGQWQRARRAFEAALDRNPRDSTRTWSSR